MRAKILIVLIIISVFVWGCQETNPVVPDAFTINGTIAFTDSNFAVGGSGQYIVTAWEPANWYPLGGNAISSQVVDVRKENNKYILGYRYRLANVPAGSYVVSVQYHDANAIKIMGIYGCNIPLDSTCLKTPTKYAKIVTSEGILGIDFNVNADTSIIINP
jgi:hypothetical protein